MKVIEEYRSYKVLKDATQRYVLNVATGGSQRVEGGLYECRQAIDNFYSDKIKQEGFNHKNHIPRKQ